MKLTLFHYWRSSSSWRVRWAMSYKKITPIYHHVHLLKGEHKNPEHLERNPFGYVPVLELPAGEFKPRFLTESMAIMEWLEETHPSPPILPRDPLERAHVRRMAETINAGTQPLQNLGPSTRHSADPAEKKKWMQHWIRNGFRAYEHWAQSTAGRFSFGDELTLADFCLIPQVYNAARQDLPSTDYPTIDRIYQNALDTPSYQASQPDNFKPADF